MTDSYDGRGLEDAEAQGHQRSSAGGSGGARLSSLREVESAGGTTLRDASVAAAPRVEAGG